MSGTNKITITELEHVAHLARISLTDQEKKVFLPQVEAVLESFDVLDRVDVSGLEPTYRVNEQSNIFHEDIIKPSFTQSEALSTAAKTKDGYFVVTGTIKK